MEGWIKLHRKLSENPLWQCEPFTRGQAWVDLVLLTNHDDNYFYKRGVKIDVKRGQCGWSELALSKRWQWSRSKVRKFLNDLEKEQQIVQQKSNVTQIITINNYDKYQEKEQQKDTKKTPKRQQKDTNKNEKNDKNEKKKNIPEFSEFKNYVLLKEPRIDLQALKFKYDSWIENDWKTGKNNNITNWKTTILNTIQYLPKIDKPNIVKPIVNDGIKRFTVLYDGDPVRYQHSESEIKKHIEIHQTRVRSKK